MSRLVFATCLAALMFFVTGCRHKEKDRLDILLEGPWILYQETQFDSNGRNVPVLIAIAPDGAIDYADIGSVTQYKPDGFHHRPPQLSTGDGYYIMNPDIYCLTFDTKCAPKGPAALNRDGYPTTMLLTMNSHDPSGGPTSWDWVSAVNGHRHTVLILPMPDSYSNDGVWYMRFAKKFDPNGVGYSEPLPLSIGVSLHYRHGPTDFNLRSCKGQPSVANCNETPKDRKGMPIASITTELTNRGTLRISMKTPDSEDACDRHVRMAYPEMLRLLNNSFNSDKAVIEPAQGTQSDHKPIFEGPPNGNFCFEHEDPQDPRKVHGADETGHAPDISILLGQVDDILKAFDEIPEELRGPLLLPEIKAARQGLDPNFPRISQTLRIGQLVRLSAGEIDALLEQRQHRQNKSSAEVGLRGSYVLGATDYDNLKALRGVEQPVVDAPPTKNGNDCKAALMLVAP